MHDPESSSTCDLATILPKTFRSPPGFCAFDGCTALASLDYDVLCQLCYATMCSDHIGVFTYGHNCPIFNLSNITETGREARKDLVQRINRYWFELGHQEVEPAARALRPNITYKVDIPRTDIMNKKQFRRGDCNIHFPVTFADGVHWLARIHFSFYTIPGEAGPLLRASEVAAQRTARDLVPEFIPAVHIGSNQNVHDLRFFFTEIARGQGHFRWPAATTFLGARSARRDKWYGNLVKDIALYMTKMSAQSFSGVGTLTFAPNGKDIVVGPLLPPGLARTEPARLKVYATTAECYVARIDHLLHMVRQQLLGWNIRRGFLYHPSNRNPVWLYMSLLEAKELVLGCEEMNRPEPTYLRHADDHAGQYLTKGDGHLSALIDWEYSATLPFAEAFASPRLLYEPCLVGIEVHNFENSRNNNLNELEIKLQQELVALGRLDIAAAVDGGRKYQRLQSVIGGALISYEHLAGMRLAFNPEAAIPESQEEWIAAAKIKFAADTDFAAVIAAYEEKLEEEKREADKKAEASSEEGDLTTTDTSVPSERTEESADTVAAAKSLPKAPAKGRRQGLLAPVRAALNKLHKWRIRVLPPPSQPAPTAKL